MKPFWARFTEGLADLAVRIIESKAKRRWPGLADNAPAEAPRQSCREARDIPASGQPCEGCRVESAGEALAATVLPLGAVAGRDGSEDDDPGASAWHAPG